MRYMLADAVFGSPAGEIQSAQLLLGVDRTCELVRPLYEAGVEDLRPRWRNTYNRMAAKVPDATTNHKRGGALLLALGLSSAEMLEAKASEIRRAMMKEAAKVDQGSVDYEARREEISRARSENRQSCGLIKSALQPNAPTEQKMGVN